jgi:hypothetical protein
MARSVDHIKFEIYLSSTWVDYTDKIVNIDIVRGNLSPIYYWDHPDTGVLTVVSRNELLDPTVTSALKPNIKCRITADSTAIFTGWIQAIDVNSQVQDDPIIELTAIDTIGLMSKTYIDHATAYSFQGWSVSDFYTHMNTAANYQKYGFTEFSGSLSSTTFTYGTDWADNSNMYDNYKVMSQFSEPFGWSWCKPDGSMIYKNNGELFGSVKLATSKIRFTDDKDAIPGTGAWNTSVETFYDPMINDNFEKIVNQFTLYNKYGRWTNSGTTFTSGDQLLGSSSNQTSVNNYGMQGIEIHAPIYFDTISGGQITATLDDFESKVIPYTAKPLKELNSIRWNGITNVTKAKGVDIADNILVGIWLDKAKTKRYVGKLNIVGIRHTITPDDWFIDYSLRNLLHYDQTVPKPEISSNQTTGPLNTPFTFECTNLDPEFGYSFEWRIGSLTSSVESTADSWTKTWTNVGDIGTKNIYLTVTDDYGFVRSSDAYPITVTGAAPVNTWEWEVNPRNPKQIDFKFTGSSATSYSWNFGDSTSGTYAVMGHEYSGSFPQTLTVSLAATNVYGTTTVSQSVTIPGGTKLSDTGFRGIRWLKLRASNTGVTGFYHRGMKNFAIKDSTNTVNRTPLAGPYRRSSQSTPSAIEAWYKGTGGTTEWAYTSQENPFLLTTNTGIYPKAYPSPGTYNPAYYMLIDLGDIYYDLKNFTLEAFTPTAQSPSTVTVYVDIAADAWGDSITEATTTWQNIGYFTLSSNGVKTLTLASGVTLPLNA